MGGIGRTNAGGSGGAALNFKVVGGTTEPVNPKENMIWVKTERIGAWYFSATQPEGLLEWDVWFPTGTASTVEFNALKKNAVQVYPLSAKQMVSGALMDVTAKSYQNETWNDWILYLFNYGKQSYKWQPRGWKHSSSGQVAIVPTVKTNADGSLTFSVTGSGTNYAGGGGMELVEDFDLTGVKTLELEFTYGTTQTKTPSFSLIVIPRSATYWGTEAVASTSSDLAEGTISLDVSQCPAGSYNISIVLWINTANNSGGTITCTMKTLKALR
jgi:hypothetical protein